MLTPSSICLFEGSFFSQDATSIHQSDSAGLTPIHLATLSGLSSIIEELVSLGAGVNPQSHDGQTPLHFAIRLCRCKKRQVEVTTALQQVTYLLFLFSFFLFSFFFFTETCYSF